MLFNSGLIMAIFAATSVVGHMNMNNPPPLSYKGNPNTKEANIDYSITSPITAAQYPCKNNLKLLGQPDGTAVATFSAGQSSSMSVEGGAFHNGGSCQLSLSYDKGKTFTVIKSFIGSCPTQSGGTFKFAIPSDAPSGNGVIFAWTWVNKVGNREFYMSCAVVNIKGSGKRAVSANEKRAVAFANRPQVFQANLGGKYCTKEGIDTVFPEPGPDVETNASNPGPAILCATGADAPAGSSTDSGSGSGSGSSSGPSSSTPSSVSSAPAQGSATSSAVYVTPASTPPANPSNTLSTLSTTPATNATATSGILTIIPITKSTLTLSSSTPTGGVFLTTGGVATPTTLVTATSVSAPASSSAAASASSAPASSAPAATPTSSVSQPAPTGGASGAAGLKTGACTTEGEWNCLDGSSYQRCASGAWTVSMPMAAGTKCSVGMSNNLAITKLRRARRGVQNW
ncbi:hypothetical protein F4777DRAFT_342900 [Nemania sp. FL0916]|nr:hypothetical protein F4777DRAFT_342900 [Nemania sp. FL0916]